MTDILNGIRVIELAAWSFVPSAGAVLADWGADVIKIEHPETGDPQRGLISSGIVAGAGGVNHFIEQPNRGKRGFGLDTATPEGLELLMKLVETADVFLTNLLPESRQRMCGCRAAADTQPKDHLRPRPWVRHQR
jgi:crotonobetainyl-CoA:carnitine CoA-transferase CaiB-like acyl-CoA transferase